MFDEPPASLILVTDEGKVSQILRNFISNAIKFTEQGEVRVYAEVCGDGRLVRFGVDDTGIGMAPKTSCGSSRSSRRSPIACRAV